MGHQGRHLRQETRRAPLVGGDLQAVDVRISNGEHRSAHPEHVHAVVMDLTGLGVLELTDNLSAFLRAGVYRATLDTSIRGVDDHTNGNFTYGAGLEWNLAMLSGLGVRFDWQRYKKVGSDTSLYGANTYDVLNASLFWRFR